MDSFAKAAIGYIKKLIRIQLVIRRRYRRFDQEAVNEVIDRLKPLVENNHYDDHQARKFWEEKSWMIRILMPSTHYRGYAKLISEFSELDEKCLWGSLSEALSK